VTSALKDCNCDLKVRKCDGGAYIISGGRIRGERKLYARVSQFLQNKALLHPVIFIVSPRLSVAEGSSNGQSGRRLGYSESFLVGA